MSRRHSLIGASKPYLYKEEDAEFYYRQTSGGVIMNNNPLVGSIDRIKGQTIAWNQCVNVTNGSSSSKGVTISRQDGVLSVSGAFDGSDTRVDIGIMEFKCIDTHKYYIYIPNKLMSTGVLCNTGGNSSSYNTDNIKDIKTASVTKNNAYVMFRYKTPNVELSGSTTINIFDLTLIYGKGNEPSTPEQFETDYQKWFGKPLTYEPYDEGSLKNVMLDGLKTIGFNQWDEEWENGAINVATGNYITDPDRIRPKNFISVLPNTSYYIHVASKPTGQVYVIFYSDDDMTKMLSYTTITSTRTFITPTNCRFIKFSFETITQYGGTYNHDICINISNPAKNGTYEPYEENTISIPTTAMTGKLNGEGESVVIFPDGMKGVNDVHDEIYYVGGKTYAVKRVGRVNLGTFDYYVENGKSSDVKFFVTTNDAIPALKNISINTSLRKTCVPIYSLCAASGIFYSKPNIYTPYTDKIYSTDNYKRVRILDKSFTFDGTGASNLKTSLDGVYLDYELAEPLVYEVDDFTLPIAYNCEAIGTEEILPEEIGAGIAPIMDITYNIGQINN